MKKNIRIATRKSKLALWQANFVKSAIENQHPDCTVKLIEVVTEGDKNQTTALSAVGGKSNFVKALQTVLLNNEADIAVHSMKDMSVHDTNGLTLAAICEREDPRDAFLSNQFETIESLPQKAVVGTASPRRECITKSLRPDLQIKLLRGNVDTRLNKLDSGEYDAIILATAGLKRLNLAHRIRSHLEDDIFVPAIAQGAIGIECRENDMHSREMVQFLHHHPTAICVNAERRINQILGGDCHTPVGAHAKLLGDEIQLSALIGTLDGKTILRALENGNLSDAIAIAERVANMLLAQGAREIF